MFSFFLPIYDMFLFGPRPPFRQQYPVMIYRGNIHKSIFCANGDSIQESQTPSPATTPQEHHTPIARPTRRPASYFTHTYRSSTGMTNGGPSHAQVVVACVAPERYAGPDSVQNSSAARAAHAKLHLWPRFETSTSTWRAQTWITKLWWRLKTCWRYRQMSWSGKRRDAVVRIPRRVRDAQRAPHLWG